MIRNCFGVSSIFTVGGSGDSITAQEESFGNAPVGARRTRKTPSRKAVMRTLAAPAVSSTPSFSFSTRWTFPTCCQPCATTAPPLRAQASRPIPMCRATPVISTLPGMRKKRRTIKGVSYPCSYDAARRQAASHCSKNADAFAPSMRRLTASSTRHRAVSPPP